MGSVIGNFWSGENAGPRAATRVFNALIALLGIIAIAVITNHPGTGIIYYIILGIATLWSGIVLSAASRIHPGFLLAIDLLLALVHYVFGIINAVASSSYRGNAIQAEFLLVVAILQTVFFVLACRDTHVRRTSSMKASRSAKDGFENF